MILALLIFVPIPIALLTYLLKTNITRLIAGLLQLCVIITASYLFYYVRVQDISIIFYVGSVDVLSIPLILNRLSSLFLLLTALIFTVSFLYTLTRETTHGLFVFLLFSLQALIFTAFLSDDLFNIYLVLEISSILCSMLILYNRTIRSLYDGMVYLLTNMVGMLFFLMGLGYMYKIFGHLTFTALAPLVASFENTQALALPYAFLLTGITLKCSFLPLHSWLPKAHGTPGAPAVVSAILSGIYVKCGLFLFMRVRLLFLPVINTDSFFLVIGFLTGIAGIIFALMQTDLKLILAFHTISQLGLILIGISLSSEYALSGAILHIVNHAFFKSLLFLCAGILIKQYKTRNIYEIRGVLKTMPSVAIALFAGILGITGAPFFNGSISKYFIQSGGSTTIAQVLIIIINLGTCLSFVKYGSMLFGKPKENSIIKNDIPSMCALFILALACLLSGVFGEEFMLITLGSSYTIDIASYILKAIQWFTIIGTSVLIYIFIISKSAFFHKGHNPEIEFGTMNFLTITFFVSILAYVLFVI